MRYYAYNEYEPDNLWATEEGAVVVTVSEEDIRRDYWPYWYERMCERFSQEQIDKNWTFEDCLEDWIIVNWAWEVKDND